MKIAPPPWTLMGNGLVLLYCFPHSFVMPWIPADLRGAYIGGFGAVMCVDYHTTDVGPYHELLFIPGQFAVAGRRHYSVTQIFVSTETSVVSGRANWAIPKQQAEFFVGHDVQHFSAIDAGSAFFSVDSEAVGPSYPANTAWLPIQPALVQKDDHGTFVTQPSGRGAVRRARVWRITGDGVHFPDLSRFRPLLAVAVHGFTLRFPAPETVVE